MTQSKCISTASKPRQISAIAFRYHPVYVKSGGGGLPPVPFVPHKPSSALLQTDLHITRSILGSFPKNTTSEGVLYYRNQPRSGSYPPLTVQQNVMCSRPGPRYRIRHERGNPIFRLPPMISCNCLLLPSVPFAICAVSRSRVRRDVMVRPPPPTLFTFPRPPRGLSGCCPK